MTGGRVIRCPLSQNLSPFGVHSRSANSHGTAGEAMTYFANCIARSAQDGSKEVPSYSRPVRVRRM
jgi:hypothetical protein